MINRKDKTIQFSEYAGHFSDHINNAEKLRTESLQRLYIICSKREKYQQRQLKRLASKFGEKHPRVLRQAERIIDERERRNYLSFIIDKAESEIDSIKDSFILHGRVVADNIKGLSGFRVQLQDAKNNVIVKPVKTNKEGFYSLVIDVDESDKPKLLNVVISDKQGVQIHKEKLPVLVKADSVEARDIVIAAIDKISRDKDIVLNEVLKTPKPKARRKASSRVKSVKKSVKRTRVRKQANKKT